MVNGLMRPRSFGTHDGSFHADEITACALLVIFDKIDLDKILRTRDIEELDKCEYVCDVGGVYDTKCKRFDHHQTEYKGGYSSAGMVLKYLKEQRVIEWRLYRYLNAFLVKGVDAIDTGRATPQPGHSTFSSIIANFVPIHYDAEPQVLRDAFFQALDFCIGHIKRLIARFYYIQKYRSEVKSEMSKNAKVMFFDRPMPWLEVFFELGGHMHPAVFIIMPTGSQWKLRAIPPTYDKRMRVRVPLPKEWAGLIDEELKERSRIPGAVFCHKGRFISVWETKEDAIKACEYVLRGRKKGNGHSF